MATWMPLRALLTLPPQLRLLRLSDARLTPCVSNSE